MACESRAWSASCRLVVASVTGDREATSVWGRSSAEEWLPLGAAPAKSDIRDGVELLLVADHGRPTPSAFLFPPRPWTMVLTGFTK